MESSPTKQIMQNKNALKNGTNIRIIIEIVSEKIRKYNHFCKQKRRNGIAFLQLRGYDKQGRNRYENSFVLSMGMSTSIVVSAMKKAAQKQGKSYDISRYGHQFRRRGG